MCARLIFPASGLQALAYRGFWFVGAACQFVSLGFLLQLSHFKRQPGSADAAGEESVGAGARWCDGLCFRAAHPADVLRKTGLRAGRIQ